MAPADTVWTADEATRSAPGFLLPTRAQPLPQPSLVAAPPGPLPLLQGADATERPRPGLLPGGRVRTGSGKGRTARAPLLPSLLSGTNVSSGRLLEAGARAAVVGSSAASGGARNAGHEDELGGRHRGLARGEGAGA